MKVAITAQYSTGCFCEKPALDAKVITDYRPRFEFRKAAQKLAGHFGMTDIQWNTAEKGATAILNAPCSHFANQTVRITWNLDYAADKSITKTI